MIWGETVIYYIQHTADDFLLKAPLINRRQLLRVPEKTVVRSWFDQYYRSFRFSQLYLFIKYILHMVIRRGLEEMRFLFYHRKHFNVKLRPHALIDIPRYRKHVGTC